MPGCSRYFVNTCLIVLSCAPALFGTRGETREYTLRANSDLVLLDVGVRDGTGRYVTDLAQSNFAVLENGEPQKIAYFGHTDAPVTVGLVLDNSGSMASKRNEVIYAGLSFASTSNPHDEYFVLNFNDRLEYGLPKSLPFTDDIRKLREGLNFGRPAGKTKLYDAIAAALQHLSESTQPYRVLIVVSDGGDNDSVTTANELLRLVEQSRATIYTVGLLDPLDHDLNPGVLKKLAKVSGGEYFQPEVLDGVVPVFKRISDEVRHRYVLGYFPDETGDGPKVRNIKVTATAEGRRLAVRSRTTYILEPAKEQRTRMRVPVGQSNSLAPPWVARSIPRSFCACALSETAANESAKKAL